MKKTANSVILVLIKSPITWSYYLHNISGLKFKLVKSNSCSSRLELAGTGLDEKQLRDNQTIMESIQNRSLSPQPDAEESVKTLVSRLEIGAINQKSMPRIIESKCIEKMTDSIKTPEQQEQHALTVKNYSTIKDEPRLRPVDILTQVTVNNHISYSPPAQLNPHAITTVQPLPPLPSTDTNRLNKVGRNRNVDLAFNSMNKSVNTSSSQSEVAPPSAKSIITPATTMATTKTILSTTAPKTLERENQHASLINSAVSTTYLKNAKNLLNHNSDAAATTQPPTMVSTRRDSGNSNNNSNIINHNNKSNRNDTVANIDVAENPVGPRLVKWNTLSKFDEKNYVTNDVKLKQKPKYDDIEFEEFEVFDPNKPPNTECYDSLNDK